VRCLCALFVRAVCVRCLCVLFVCAVCVCCLCALFVCADGAHRSFALLKNIVHPVYSSSACFALVQPFINYLYISLISRFAVHV
jgi:hypothetical protein